MVKELKIHKSTIIFKINIFNLIEKYPKLMGSSATLNFLKKYLKGIKKVCEDNLKVTSATKLFCHEVALGVQLMNFFI